MTVGSKLKKQTAVAVRAISEYQVADLAELKIVVGFINVFNGNYCLSIRGYWGGFRCGCVYRG